MSSDDGVVRNKEGEPVGYYFVDKAKRSIEEAKPLVPRRSESIAELAAEYAEKVSNVQAVRVFETGATRSSVEGRYDPEGYGSPLVAERFAEYMHKHQKQADGTLRASDNWQKGMSLESYAAGLQRHDLHFWLRHRGFEPRDSESRRGHPRGPVCDHLQRPGILA